MHTLKKSVSQIYKAKWNILSTWVSDVGGETNQRPSSSHKASPDELSQATSDKWRPCPGPPCQERADYTQRVGTFWLTETEPGVTMEQWPSSGTLPGKLRYQCPLHWELFIGEEKCSVLFFAQKHIVNRENS